MKAVSLMFGVPTIELPWMPLWEGRAINGGAAQSDVAPRFISDPS